MIIFSKKVFLCTLLIIFAFYAFLLYTPASEERDYLISEAIKLINSQAYNAAITMLERALEVDKSYDYTYFLMGEAYHYQKKYNLAIENYKKSIDLNPEVGEAYYNIASAYYALDDKKLSIKWLDRAKSIYYKNNNAKKYQKVLEQLINLSEGEAHYAYKEELKTFLSSGTLLSTPTPAEPVPTVLPDFSIVSGNEMKAEPPYPLTINDEPFKEKLIFDDKLKKLYVPALEFLRDIGFRGQYDFYKGDFLANDKVIPRDFLRMDKYQTVYVSVIDALEFLRISYVYSEVLGNPVIIAKPEGLDFDPNTYLLTPRPTPYTNNNNNGNGGTDYYLTPFPTPNW